MASYDSSSNVDFIITECCSKCISHVGDESERQSSGDHRVDQREDNEAVHDEPQHDGAEVPAQLVQDNTEVLSAEDLPSYEEEDADRSEVDNPSSDRHHGVRQTREKCQ